jgi:hypothetical protein
MTTRASPERSFDAACRHLFRHLREPEELRRNPLVSAHFSREIRGAARIRSDAAVASAIRETVRRCAAYCLESERLEDEEIAMYRHAIVVQSDLEGIRRDHLAARLGISARHYTRLQRDIRRRIAIMLPPELNCGRDARTTSSVTTRSPLRQAAILAGSGSPSTALAQLASVARTSGNDCLAVGALCLQALIRQRYVGDVAGANAALAATRSLLQKSEPGDPVQPFIKAEIELAVAEVDIESGHYDHAVATSVRIAQTLAQTNDAATWLRLRALSFAAYCHFVMGKRKESLQFLRSALLDLGASKHAPPPDRVELLLWIAVVLAELGRSLDSSRILAEAWLAARQANLKLDVIRLDLLHAAIALECSAVTVAPERLSEICEESRQLECGNLCAQAHAYLARAQIRASRPRPTHILGNAQRVLDLSRSKTPLWIEGKVAESFARLMLRDVAGAERAARAADDAAATAGNRVGRGSALRELARVAHAQGRKRDAKRTIMAAVEAGYSAGKPQQTAQALELAAQIFRQPIYREEATVLRNALHLSGSLWS